MKGSPAKTGQHRKNWRPAALAIGLALVFHAFFLLTDVLPRMLQAFNSLRPRQVEQEATRVEMVSMTPAMFEQNRQVAADLEPLAPPPEPPPEPPPKPQGQVVDLAPTPDRRPPLEARFLSEHDTRVAQEMASADKRPDYEKPQPQPQRPQASAKPKAKRPAPAQPKPAAPQPEQAAPEQAEPAAPAEDRPAEAPADPPPDGTPRLAMAEAGDQAVANEDLGAPAPDYIHDVNDGPATFLNSREYLYATFFNRVKQGVGQVWHPSVRETMDRFATISDWSDRDEFSTLVAVDLEPSGKLKTVALVRSCGVPVIDELALRAFHQAAPFPNPPQGLVGQDGRIRFQFGFRLSQRQGPTAQAFLP